MKIYLDKAKNGMSKCRVCNERIAAFETRVVFSFNSNFGQSFAYIHLFCLEGVVAEGRKM